MRTMRLIELNGMDGSAFCPEIDARNSGQQQR